MALGTFVAGAYLGTLNSVALGLAQEGYELEIEPKQTLINRSDAWGDSLLDTIFRGIDANVQAEFMEYKAGPISAMNQFASFGLATGVIGRMGSDIATALVLTATPNTPAAASPASLTATKAILAPNHNPRLVFNSVLRTVPIRWALLIADLGAGVYRHFSTT